MNQNELPMTDTPPHVLDVAFKVRDYECDMGHVVNHPVYLNYLEHARHELLGGLGIKFGDLAKRGIYLVVTRIEADYKASLTSGDTFIVRTELQRKGRVRLQFKQQIHRTPDNRLMFSAVVTGTAVNERGRPEIPLELERVLGVSSA